MDEEMFSTPSNSSSPDALQFPTEKSEEPSSIQVPVNHIRRPHLGFHPGFDISAPELVTLEHVTNAPPSACPLDYTYDFPATSFHRQHMDSWNSWTRAHDELLLSPTEPGWQMNCPWLITGRTMVPVPAQAQSTHFLNPSQFHFPTDYSHESDESAERTGSNPNMRVHHAELFGMTLREDSNITHDKHQTIQEEAQSGPGDGRDFGEILNRAMNRASGRLIALLQEELKRLSSENELIDEIDETDEALSNLNLDSRKSRCRL